MKESGMRSSPSGLSSSPGGGSSAGGKKAIGKAIKGGGMLFRGKGAASIARQEEEIRGRMTQASDGYQKAVRETQTMRQEYFNFQLPKTLRVSRGSVGAY